MIRKFLTSVAVAGLAAGAANALGLENLELAAAPTNPYPVADSLDFTMTTETVNVGFGPSAGSFPTGNVLVFVDVSGGTFNAALDGTEATIAGGGTSVISSGGLKGGSTVTFLVSGADACAADATAAAMETTCSLNIPLDLDGSDVSFSVGLETDAGAPVDNSAEDNRVSLTVIDTAPAFAVSVVADMNPTTADLNATNGPFEDLVMGGANDAILGTITAGANAVSYDGGMTTDTVNSDFAGTDVAAANAGAITFTLTGEQDAFDTMAGGDIAIDVMGATITPNAATDVAQGTLVFGATSTVTVVPDTNVAIERSDYEVAVSIAAAVAGPIQQAASGSGSLQTIDRNGTTIVFPWTQSATQGAASGTTSVYRFGNLDSIATGAVFVEVKNASEAGYTNPGIVQVNSSIAAGGEFVTNSTTLETALGNYGRGDLEFTAEADPSELTGRQFVVRNGVIQQVTGGTIQQDLN